jgi:hypothetical protein
MVPLVAFLNFSAVALLIIRQSSRFPRTGNISPIARPGQFTADRAASGIDIRPHKRGLYYGKVNLKGRWPMHKPAANDDASYLVPAALLAPKARPATAMAA